MKNGTLGTVEKAATDRLAVRLDDGRRVDVDLKNYAHVDHGYAATVHKIQGMTVDRTHVLATPGLDAHSSYVALSRHRDGTALHYGRDDFADDAALRRTLARERPKDMALDYERPAAPSPARPPSASAVSAQDGREITTPGEQPRGFAALVSRALGRASDVRTADAARAGGDRSASAAPAAAISRTDDRSAAPDRNGEAVRRAEKEAGARVGAVAQGRGTDASRSADPANSDQAKALRAMIAARNGATRPTPASIREAVAAAKKTAGLARDQDYGAER